MNRLGVILCTFLLTASLELPAQQRQPGYPSYPGQYPGYPFPAPGGQQTAPQGGYPAPPSSQPQMPSPYGAPTTQQPQGTLPGYGFPQPYGQQPFGGYPGGQPQSQQPYGAFPGGQPQPQQPYGAFPGGQPQPQQPYGSGYPATQPQAQPPYGSGFPGAQPQQSQPYQAYPGRQQQQGVPGWTQPQGTTYPGTSTASQINAPRVEIALSDTTPYVQQTLILTLSLVSGSSLASANPELPANPDIIFNKLDGPVTSMRSNGGGQSVVNTFRYAITPIQPGDVLIPPIVVKGTYASGGTPFESRSAGDSLMQVQPIDPAVQPWLPLHGMVLQSVLENAENPEAGKPIQLHVDISAVGATGTQLSSMEQQLQGEDFRVYRESSETKGSVSPDGQYLLGQRTEIYTLVPLHGGKVHIPQLRIHWWNVDTGKPETSTVPLKQLLAAGEPGPDGYIADLFPGASSLLLWVPLTAVFGVTIGVWILAWVRRKRFAQVMEEEMALTANFAITRIKLFGQWLAPIRRLQRLRQLSIRALPRSYRLWFCVRLVNSENDPEIWSYMLRFLANKHLQIPAQLPLPELARRLSAIHRAADPDALLSMMLRLDGALYHGEPVDFRLWKRDFRAQLRPPLLPTGRGPAPVAERARHHFPPLNPAAGSVR